MPWRSLLTVNCSPPGNSATSNLALLTSIPTTTCSTICPPPPVSSPPGFSLPCGAIRAWLSLATVRALTWRLGAWRPRSATVSMDSGEHGLPRLSFSLVWDSSDKIQGDSNCRSSLAFFVPWKRPESPAVFGQNFPVDRSENNSLIGFSAVTPLKPGAFCKR